MKSKVLLSALMMSFSVVSLGQTYQVMVDESDEPMMQGKSEPTWEHWRNIRCRNGFIMSSSEYGHQAEYTCRLGKSRKEIRPLFGVSLHSDHA